MANEYIYTWVDPETGIRFGGEQEDFQKAIDEATAKDNASGDDFPHNTNELLDSMIAGKVRGRE